MPAYHLLRCGVGLILLLPTYSDVATRCAAGTATYSTTCLHHILRDMPRARCLLYYPRTLLTYHLLLCKHKERSAVAIRLQTTTFATMYDVTPPTCCLVLPGHVLNCLIV